MAAQRHTPRNPPMPPMPARCDSRIGSHRRDGHSVLSSQVLRHTVCVARKTLPAQTWPRAQSPELAHASPWDFCPPVTECSA
jgi:hypothetical protein